MTDLGYFRDRTRGGRPRQTGTKPSELPIYLESKYELLINLKVAMSLGLTIPTSLLVRADEVIE
jgi:ABC-type uncharacterized transport system substrate-binding protein